jgi:hypothetical protein
MKILKELLHSLIAKIKEKLTTMSSANWSRKSKGQD